MFHNDPISDMVCRIKNAQKAGFREVVVPFSKCIEAILRVLKEEGYVVDFVRQELRKGVNVLNVTLSYTDTAPVIQEFKRVSKPGRRVYVSRKKMPKFKNGLGVNILSTPKGILADHQAFTLNVAGELLCSVF